MKFLHWFLSITLLFLTACTSNHTALQKTLSKDDASNYVYKGHYKVGKPYTIKNVTYKPIANIAKNYVEHGEASWYGKNDHNKLTANGDIFNKHILTAAHRTLPLPCVVKVTNVTNKKQVILMVNDRGPFNNHSKRVLDVSEAAAKRLGFKEAGLTNVKIEYMHQETDRLLSRLQLDKKHGSRPKAQFASATSQKCSINCHLELLNAKHNLVQLSAAQRSLYEKSIAINNI